MSTGTDSTETVNGGHADNTAPLDDRPHRVVFAVCTRNRPRMLGECLASVLQLDIPDRTVMDILLVDNSEDPAMRQRNRDVLAGLPGGEAITVQHEPRMGIPFARNRAIDRALETGADALIFLDDDQTVPRDWLTVVDRVAREESADVVKTEVTFVLEGKARYAEQFEDRRRRAPDSVRTRGVRFLSTNGVWISARIFGQLAIRFDEQETLSGGDDTSFFLEAFDRGAMMVETFEVQAPEMVPAEKQTLRWLLQRSFNGGVGRAATRQNNKTPIYYLFSGLSQALLYGFIALFLFWNPPAFVYRLRRAAQAVGLMRGAFGHKPEGYRRVVGQ